MRTTDFAGACAAIALAALGSIWLPDSAAAMPVAPVAAEAGLWAEPALSAEPYYGERRTLRRGYPGRADFETRRYPGRGMVERRRAMDGYGRGYRGYEPRGYRERSYYRGY